MFRKYFHLVIIIFLLTPALFYSQTSDVDYAKDNHFRYDDYEYSSNIKTVMLHRDLGDPTSTNDQLSDPIISLGAHERLLLSFDDLNGGGRDYYYTFIHCDAHWQPSDINIYDVIKGYTEDRITNYSSSSNTYQNYTHYSLSFPNEAIRLMISGNYIIKVFADDDPDQVVLTRRFMIVDRHVNINASVDKPSTVSEIDSKQAIDFSIINRDYPIADAYQELTVVIKQNGRWDNEISNLKPLFVKDNEFDYSYQDGNLFNGANEFRWFDTRTLQSNTERTLRLEKVNDTFQVYLTKDPNLSSQRYSTVDDINGHFYIHTQDVPTPNPDVECDYSVVHFNFPYVTPIDTGNFYIFGALTDWTVRKEAMLTYDFNAQAYKGSLYVKQGYYNYWIVFVGDKSGAADETLAEGNHWETENDYTILVYDHPISSRYDQLIGIKKINSMKTY